jgi:RNA 2',3'-cyclic 3'-phosphodiesterase
MPEQLSLAGLEATAEFFRPDIIRRRHGEPLGFKLFFGLFLPPVDAPRVAQVACALCTQHGLFGTPLAADRMHVTLNVVGDFRNTIPMAVVNAARMAAASVVCPPLRIVFDRVLSFQPNNAFVLRCESSSDAAIARLRQTLAQAMRRVGLHPAPSRTPHMTLLYAADQITEQRVEPIQWTAAEFALVLSHTGQAYHQWIDRWTLVDPRQSSGL